MPAKRFLIYHPDGSKEQVRRQERDELILGGLIAPIASGYKYLGQLRTFHAFADLASLRQQISSKYRQEPDYYPGQFIFQLGQKRQSERLESSEALILRINSKTASQQGIGA